MVWDHIAQVEYRSILMGSDRQEIDRRVNGRVSEGSKYICYHGDKVNVQTIVLWKPFEHMITHDLVDIPFPDTTVVIDYRLYPTENGTRFVHAFGKAVSGSWLAKQFVRIVVPTLKKDALKGLEAFRDAVEAHTSEESGNALSGDAVAAAARTSLGEEA